MIGRFSILQTFCEQAVSRELLSATKTFLCVQFIVFSVFVVNIWSPAPELVTAPARLSPSGACQCAAMPCLHIRFRQIFVNITMSLPRSMQSCKSVSKSSWVHEGRSRFRQIANTNYAKPCWISKSKARICNCTNELQSGLRRQHERSNSGLVDNA